MSKPITYVHPDFVPATRWRIDPSDAGFVWGATVTDRVRTFNGELFRLDEHLCRFRESCRLARVPLNVTDDRISEVAARLVSHNRRPDRAGTWWELSVIFIATPGRHSSMAWWPGGRLSQFVAYTEKLNPLHTKKLHREGARLRSFPLTSCADPRIKHRSRLAWWVAAEQVHDEEPGAAPLFVEPSTQNVLETPTANLLAVFDGTITSPPSGSVLPGVSVGVVRELADRLAIPFAERPFPVAELASATEILLTNTTHCLAGVSRLNGKPVPFPGPILNRLLDAWSVLVGVDVRQPRGC